VALPEENVAGALYEKNNVARLQSVVTGRHFVYRPARQSEMYKKKQKPIEYSRLFIAFIETEPYNVVHSLSPIHIYITQKNLLQHKW